MCNFISIGVGGGALRGRNVLNLKVFLTNTSISLFSSTALLTMAKGNMGILLLFAVSFHFRFPSQRAKLFAEGKIHILTLSP